MKKETAFLSAVLVGALVAIACQSRPHSMATAPSATVAAQDGGASATVFSTPSSSPIGPKPGGTVGPSPRGTVGPSPGPGASPASSPMGPSPGFPGTSTPTPTPGATPTPGTTPPPGTTPTPGVCGAPGVHTYQVNVPFPTSGGGNGPSIVVSDLTGCHITAVETSFTATAADLAVATADKNNFSVGLFISGVIIDNFLIRGVKAPLTGTTMGTTCGDLLFKDGGLSFDTATPPYAGVFRPRGGGSFASPTLSFSDFIGLSANGTWELPFYGVNAPMSVDCWVLQLTVS